MLSKGASSLPTYQPPPSEPSCSSTSKWLFAACVVGGVVGIVFISLGALQVFGATGEIGFIASIVAGGGLTLICVGGGLWIIRCRSQEGPQQIEENPSTSHPAPYNSYGGPQVLIPTYSGYRMDVLPSPQPLPQMPTQTQHPLPIHYTHTSSPQPPPQKTNINPDWLCNAAEKGDLQEVRRLVEAGANINGRHSRWNNTPLFEAVSHGQLEVVRFLACLNNIQLDAPNSDEQTALHRAANRGSKDIVELLVRQGANINAKDVHEQTPLHLAVDNLPTLQYLLSKDKVTIEARNYWGKTPLLSAFAANRLDAAKALHAAGADLRANSGGRTALHFAAEHDNIEAIKFLLSQGLDIDAKDEDGRTPLHCAAVSQTGEAYRYLLDQGAIDSPDKYGSSAAHKRNYTHHF